MTVTSLSEQETKKRFGVSKEIKSFPGSLTKEEERNVSAVLEYMDIAYTYDKNTGKSSVTHLCAKSNEFEAPSTFPTAHTAEEYAESHSKVLASLQDLHIVQFDLVVAKENFVSLRYTATGSHQWEDHNGIKATGNRGKWTAAGNFILNDEGKIQHWYKDWDKMRMWKSLGWVKGEGNDAEFA